MNESSSETTPQKYAALTTQQLFFQLNPPTSYFIQHNFNSTYELLERKLSVAGIPRYYTN